MRAVPPIWREGRVAREALALRRHSVFAGDGVPHGAGEPVLLVPGFLAGDPSLQTMGAWLRRIGYRPHRSSLLANVDCATRTLDRLAERVETLSERHGRPVLVVGQSRGGALARLLAVREPERIAGIVCLGSPVGDQLAVHPLVAWQVRLVGLLGSLRVPGLFSRDCLDGDCCAATRELETAPFPHGVGYVSVYSRSDGIVDWRACLDPAARQVEVEASHCGMAVSAPTYVAVAEALASFGGRASAVQEAA